MQNKFNWLIPWNPWRSSHLLQHSLLGASWFG